MLFGQLPKQSVTCSRQSNPVEVKAYITTTELDMQACATTLSFELPDWFYQRQIHVPATGALARALEVWWRLQPEELKPAVITLMEDEIFRWRVSEFVTLRDGNRQASKLRAAIQTLEDHPFGRPSLGQLASAACLTPFHFCRLFNANFGISPGHFIKRQQLLRGADMLAGSSSSISQIALRLDVSLPYFCSLCRQHYGMTPRALRGWLRNPASPLFAQRKVNSSSPRSYSQCEQECETFSGKVDVECA